MLKSEAQKYFPSNKTANQKKNQPPNMPGAGI